MANIPEHLDERLEREESIAQPAEVLRNGASLVAEGPGGLPTHDEASPSDADRVMMRRIADSFQAPEPSKEALAYLESLGLGR
jgi:hypothetical protein